MDRSHRTKRQLANSIRYSDGWDWLVDQVEAEIDTVKDELLAGMDDFQAYKDRLAFVAGLRKTISFVEDNAGEELDQ